MKYTEYQIWYHVYSGVLKNLVRQDEHRNPETLDSYIEFADRAGDFALQKLKQVEIEELKTPSLPAGFDMQELVNSIAKNVMQKKGK